MKHLPHLSIVLTLGVLATLVGCGRQDVSKAVNGTSASPQVSDSQARTGFADLGGARIAYQIHGELGTGRIPLVVLHGSLMSAESMMPMVQAFVATRPIIAIDARGHGRTGDVPGPITYELMADDVAAVATVLELKRVDLLGYSMGATTALIAAARHPEVIGKQVIISGVSERAGWVPEAQASFEKWNAAMFAGTPIEAAYKRASATPEAFSTVVDKLRELETANYDLSLAALRAIKGKTMIVAGDYDGLQLSHALKLFAARGGSNEEVATKGFLSSAPRTRLAILPATSHIGMSNQGELLAQLVVPFLDDEPPAPPSGFFAGMDQPADESKQ